MECSHPVLMHPIYSVYLSTFSEFRVHPPYKSILSLYMMRKYLILLLILISIFAGLALANADSMHNIFIRHDRKSIHMWLLVPAAVDASLLVIFTFFVKDMAVVLFLLQFFTAIHICHYGYRFK